MGAFFFVVFFKEERGEMASRNEESGIAIVEVVETPVGCESEISEHGVEERDCVVRAISAISRMPHWRSNQDGQPLVARSANLAEFTGVFFK